MYVPIVTCLGQNISKEGHQEDKGVGVHRGQIINELATPHNHVTTLNFILQ